MSRHTYTPALLQNLNTFGANFERDDIIAIYYHAGYTVREIIGFLVTRHGIAIGERQVHRILREKQLKRRENQSSLEEIVRALLHELAGSSRNMGYRLMWRRLLTDHVIIASSETVRLALSVLDAEGVLARSRRCLHRRAYSNKGQILPSTWTVGTNLNHSVFRYMEQSMAIHDVFYGCVLAIQIKTHNMLQDSI